MHTPPAPLVASVPDPQSPQVEEAVTGKIAELGSPESRRSYEYEWRRHRQWLETEQLRVMMVRPRHVSKYMLTLRGKKSSNARALTVLRSLYGAMVRDEVIPNNPAREVRAPKVDSTPKAPWIFDSDDIKKLMNVGGESWYQRRDQLVVRLAFGLGWRRAEIARVAVEDIGEGTITAPRIKGGKSLTVGLPDRLAENIFEWRQFAGIDAGPLFPRRLDDPRAINGAIVYRVVRQMCVKAGITVIPPHGLRRTYITHAGIRKVSLKERQLSVGHSSSQTTEGYDRARDAAANAVGNVFEDLFETDDYKSVA